VVLVVDDNPDARTIIQQMLEPLGASVLLARDGDEALAMLRDAAPDVILCDILMPRMDGFELSERIRRTPGRARVPVVAVTALGSSPDYLRTWEAGFDAHISKPVDDRALASVVRDLARQGRGASRVNRRRPQRSSRPSDPP
jgi:two-component system CheB/CheR fusion protein